MSSVGRNAIIPWYKAREIASGVWLASYNTKLTSNQLVGKLLGQGISTFNFLLF